MNRYTRMLPAVPMAMAVLLSGAVDAQEGTFSEAQIFFELNDTDGDLGLHSSIDGEPWKRLEIEDPREQTILDLRPIGRLRKQGLTQLFFESAEPGFDELPPAEFFRRFPQGKYEIEAITLDGRELEGTVMLSHVLPAPAGNLLVSGLPAAENCDEELPVVSAPVVISWDPVTTSHPTIGRKGPVEVARYQVFTEQRVSGGLKFSLDLPPSATTFTVPAELIELGDPEYKFEIQVRDVNGNQTATESCFEMK